MRVWPGSPHPLGATWDGEGVNFAIVSAHATSVELCLFDEPDAPSEADRITLGERTEHVWHAYLPDARPGQCYGFRVHGPFAPEQGHRFNPAKLLLDPYAKAISGTVRWSHEMYGYRIGDSQGDLSHDLRDSAGFIPKSVVVDGSFNWVDDRLPRTPWHRTVIYECHVKGMTARHPEVPPELRGTYLGLATDAVIGHLQALGVTAVQLLPIQQFVSERHLVEAGLANYWGYNTIGFFAPDVRYASGGLGQQVSEFKTMVKRFHRAGIEVILDVVYNHTGEGNHEGPTLAFRGIDNQSYYRLDPQHPRYYLDFAGTGNTLDASQPRTLQLILDSMRYWVTEMHVDGFRFDLAPVLARDPTDFNPSARFFEIVRQDPVLANVKLIAEPWDLGPGGYHLGAFPARWSEWNDQYRDTVRRFWRGEGGLIGPLASRLSGSSDLLGNGGRGPQASLNFVACHDGFTLRDLVSYERKHNEANKEQNRDGTDANHSNNWGAEGPSKVAAVVQQRRCMVRNMLATLAFSQGVPMLSHGDEVSRTQRGNNNAYCQDNELTWMDWRLDREARDLLAFTRRVFAIRRQNPVLRRRTYFAGTRLRQTGFNDVTWFLPDGQVVGGDQWVDPRGHVLGMLIHARGGDERDERGRPLHGETVMLLLNGGNGSRRFVLPQPGKRGRWVEELNTARPPRRITGGAVNLVAHSLMLLRFDE